MLINLGRLLYFKISLYYPLTAVILTILNMVGGGFSDSQEPPCCGSLKAFCHDCWDREKSHLISLKKLFKSLWSDQGAISCNDICMSSRALESVLLSQKCNNCTLPVTSSPQGDHSTGMFFSSSSPSPKAALIGCLEEEWRRVLNSVSIHCFPH